MSIHVAIYLALAGKKGWKSWGIAVTPAMLWLIYVIRSLVVHCSFHHGFTMSLEELTCSHAALYVASVAALLKLQQEKCPARDPGWTCRILGPGNRGFN